LALIDLRKRHSTKLGATKNPEGREGKERTGEGRKE